MMPENDDNIEQEEIDEQELVAPKPVLMPVPEPQGGKWGWIGSSSRPEAQEESDGISDLFRVTDEDIGASDDDLSDLTDVDIERDVLDAGDTGDLSDLVDVTEEDIMGDELGQRPSRPASQQPRIRRKVLPRYYPPTSLGRSG